MNQLAIIEPPPLPTNSFGNEMIRLCLIQINQSIAKRAEIMITHQKIVLDQTLGQG